MDLTDQLLVGDRLPSVNETKQLLSSIGTHIIYTGTTTDSQNTQRTRDVGWQG